MKNPVLIKKLGVIALMGTVIVTAGVGTGAAALKLDGKADTASASDVKESGAAKKNSGEDSKEAKLLSKYETKNDKDTARDVNLELACSKINGYEIKPDEVFSFIDTAGPFTEAQGYTQAPVIVSDTEMGEGVGGGVCQVSTTLYNAALSGDMEIVERKRHSFPMNYASVGLDSAISTPDVDLKLKNKSDASIYVFASAKDGKVKVQLFGKPLNKEEEIRIQSVVKEEIKPEGEEVRLSDTLADGEKQVLQEERIGYEVAVYREYYKDSKLVDTETVSEDTYPAVQRIVLEGNSNTNK